MPKSERRYDRSCRNLADGRPFYQCQTCDLTKQLYLCSFCFRNGGHTQHNYTVVKSYDYLYSKIVFCNCGDITGKLFCERHRVVRLSHHLKLPLHFNQNFFDEFINDLKLPAQTCRELSRLNQIRKVHFKSEEYGIIKQYFDETNAHNTTLYFRKTYSLYRKDHEKRFVSEGHHRERRFLLWHGTKLTNLESILRDGFRRPQGKRGMFGSGVYFADRVSKSTQYCDNSGHEILFLCEVALGSMYRTGQPYNYDSAPSSFDSIKGLGVNAPDRNGQGMFDEVIVPFGKTIRNPKVHNSCLQNNEYIVYDPERILIRFIVQFDRNVNNNKVYHAQGFQGSSQRLGNTKSYRSSNTSIPRSIRGTSSVAKPRAQVSRSTSLAQVPRTTPSTQTPSAIPSPQRWQPPPPQPRALPPPQPRALPPPQPRALPPPQPRAQSNCVIL